MENFLNHITVHRVTTILNGTGLQKVPEFIREVHWESINNEESADDTIQHCKRLYITLFKNAVKQRFYINAKI